MVRFLCPYCSGFVYRDVFTNDITCLNCSREFGEDFQSITREPTEEDKTSTITEKRDNRRYYKEMKHEDMLLPEED